MTRMCDDFHDRLQETIDNREDPRSDAELNRHAMRCDSCACELEAWDRIQSLYASRPQAARSQTATAPWASRFQRNSRFHWMIAAMTAAALAFGALGTYFTFQKTPTDLVSLGENGDAFYANQDSVSVNQSGLVAEWFQQSRPQQWLDQTMPAVRNVRDGVAPLGRSLQQAVSILAPGERRTSERRISDRTTADGKTAERKRTQRFTEP